MATPGDTRPHGQSAGLTLPWNATSAGAAMPFHADRDTTRADTTSSGLGAAVGATLQTVTLRINGRSCSMSVDPRTTLLDALRDYAGLSGTKKGCGHGQCGACTVLSDGQRILSCMTFAVMAE